MKKTVVVNGSYGGFGLSEEAVRLFNERATDLQLLTERTLRPGHPKAGEVLASEVPRDHPVLVEVVRELGSERASKSGTASLRLYEITFDFEIEDFDGKETPRISGSAVEIRG